MAEAKYKRVLLKISGEALAGDAKIGINDDVLKEISKNIKAVSDLGVQVASGEADLPRRWTELRLITWECSRLS